MVPSTAALCGMLRHGCSSLSGGSGGSMVPRGRCRELAHQGLAAQASERTC